MISSNTTVNTNPFPGLRPFQEEENYLFFGRESQVDEMLKKLQRSRFLAVIGTSGSGKSSLVNCGLFPALHGGYLSKAGSSWRVAKFRPGDNPIREMTLALSKKGRLFLEEKIGNLPVSSMVNVNLLRSKLGLIETFKQARLKSHENLLVVVDQFEELFRYQKIRSGSATEEDNAFSFINLLLEAVKQSQFPIYVVITMRSDFLGDCAQFRGLPEMINEGQYLVPRMKRNERKSAIVGPVEVAGARMTERLLMRLVNDVGDNPDQLSILQHALNRTWAAWESEGKLNEPLDLQHYQQIGTMSKALDQHAEKAYHELPDERHKLVCQKIFKALTDVGTDSRGVRRPTQMKKLCEIAEASGDEVKKVLEIFRKPSRSFLMPPAGTKLEENTIVDISHESFMRIWKRLIRWTREEQESVRTYLRLSDAAMLYEDGKTALMTDPYLQFALNWKEEEKVNQAWAERYDDNFTAVMDYIRKSRREKQLKEAEAKAAAEAEQQRKNEEQEAKMRSQRKRFTIARIVGGIFIILTLVIGYLYFDSAKNERIIQEKNVALNELKRDILSRMGIENIDPEQINLERVFQVYDTLNNIKMVKGFRLQRTDTQLAGMYNLLLDEEHQSYLDSSTLVNLRRDKLLLDEQNVVANIQNDQEITLGEKLKQLRDATMLERNTPEYENAIKIYNAYQSDSANYAFISSVSDVYILSDEYASIVKENVPESESEIVLGRGGKSVHVWVDGINKNASIEFYAGANRIARKTVARGGFPSWTQQYYNPRYAGETGHVKIFNRKGDLIAKKSFSLKSS